MVRCSSSVGGRWSVVDGQVFIIRASREWGWGPAANNRAVSRIVLSTWGSLGDLHPYLALAVELKRRGHQASVATITAWREHVERAGVGFHAVGPEIPADEGAAREMVRRVLDAREGPRYLFEQVLGPATPESYEALLAAVRADGGADLLVSHTVPLTGPIVAEVTGVRWV